MGKQLSGKGRNRLGQGAHSHAAQGDRRHPAAGLCAAQGWPPALSLLVALHWGACKRLQGCPLRAASRVLQERGPRAAPHIPTRAPRSQQHHSRRKAVVGAAAAALPCCRRRLTCATRSPSGWSDALPSTLPAAGPAAGPGSPAGWRSGAGRRSGAGCRASRLGGSGSSKRLLPGAADPRVHERLLPHLKLPGARARAVHRVSLPGLHPQGRDRVPGVPITVAGDPSPSPSLLSPLPCPMSPVPPSLSQVRHCPDGAGERPPGLGARAPQLDVPGLVGGRAHGCKGEAWGRGLFGACDGAPRLVRRQLRR